MIQPVQIVKKVVNRRVVGRCLWSNFTCTQRIPNVGTIWAEGVGTKESDQVKQKGRGGRVKVEEKFVILGFLR